VIKEEIVERVRFRTASVPRRSISRWRWQDLVAEKPGVSFTVRVVKCLSIETHKKQGSGGYDFSILSVFKTGV